MELSDYSVLECTIEDGLARLVLNAPQRGNPFDGPFCREMNRVSVELSEREDVRAVLLSARGKFFSVGGDIDLFTKDRAALPPMIKVWTADLHMAIARLMRMRAPIVAAVQGSVAGGGVALVAGADLVFAGNSTKFSAAFTQIGFSCDSSSTVVLTQRMGQSRAKRFLLLAETLTAEDALRTGLADWVVADDQVLTEAEACAKRLAAGPTVAYGEIKRLMMRATSQTLESQLEDEAQALTRVSKTDDAWEGLSAFKEKRKPKFLGK